MKKNFTVDINTDNLKEDNIDKAIDGIIKNTDFNALATFCKHERFDLKKIAVELFIMLKEEISKDPLEIHNIEHGIFMVTYRPEYSYDGEELEVETEISLALNICSANVIPYTNEGDDDEEYHNHKDMYPYDYITTFDVNGKSTEIKL